MSPKIKQGIIPILLLLIALVILFSPTLGQTSNSTTTYFPILYGSPPNPPAWVGPYGGYIIAIAIAPSQPEIIYAGTWGSGIFKSTDGGASWAWKSQGLETPYINSMAVDPNDPQIVYAGTYKGKVYKTVDGGESWFQSSKNIQPEAIVYSMVIDPIKPKRIYIGTRGIANNGDPPWQGTLYRTTDAGANWEPALTDVGGSAEQDWAYSVTLHPRFPNIIFAATHEHGAYRSTDYGKHWESVNAGVTDFSSRAVVIDPHSSENNAVVYMGVWKYTGVFKSTDGGDSWTLKDNGSSEARIYSMAIDPKNSDQVYASTFSIGVIKTENGGKTWLTAGLANEEVASTAVNPENPNLLYSGTNGGGLYRSKNAGDSWKHRQKGLHARRVNAVQVAYSNQKRLFTGMNGDGVLQTLDSGENWMHLGNGLDDATVLGLVTNPAKSNFLFALTETAGLHRCNLDGTCWHQIAIDFPAIVRMQATFDEQHPFAQLPPLEPWDESENQNSTVTAQNPALLSMVFAPTNPEIAYLGTSGAGIYKSQDNGNTWQPSGLAGRKIIDIAVHPQNSESVFAATSGMVLHSNNGGLGWGNLGLADLEIYALALDSNATIYVATNNGIYYYSAGGWAHLGLGGIAVTEVRSHPSEPGWLYAGTTNGLYTSRDAGQSWEAGPQHLNGLTVLSISFDPTNPDYVYISTKTHGVLRFHNPTIH